MLYRDPIREIMQRIRKNNPDIETIELEGIRPDAFSEDFELLGKIKWRVTVSFIDEDRLVTDLYDDMMTPLEYIEKRLAKWVGQ